MLVILWDFKFCCRRFNCFCWFFNHLLFWHLFDSSWITLCPCSVKSTYLIRTNVLLRGPVIQLGTGVFLKYRGVNLFTFLIPTEFGSHTWCFPALTHVVEISWPCCWRVFQTWQLSWHRPRACAPPWMLWKRSGHFSPAWRAWCTPCRGKKQGTPKILVSIKRCKN